MPFRRTRGILTNSEKANPAIEADVIMTAAVAGFTAGRFLENQPVRFDIDPRDEKKQEWTDFQRVMNKLNAAVEPYVRTLGGGGSVKAGLAPQYAKDHSGVIMGVYGIAGQTPQASMTTPKMSNKGQALYQQIGKEPHTGQYVGLGAYTGFVDNPNGDPVGPRSTARFLMPDAAADGSGKAPVHRWLPAADSPLWAKRLRRDTKDDYVPWGMLQGEKAPSAPKPQLPAGKNEADQMTALIASQGMVYVGNSPTGENILGYTHGMIQAVYKAYSLGPACTPYEIAVGEVTTKLASCFACTMFITALGYPPSAGHLGRGESWAPLYEPYNPGGSREPNESGVIRDLNSAWSASCDQWLRYGIGVLNQARVAKSHAAALADLSTFMDSRHNDPTVSATLILDALTLHDKEIDRIDRTLEN